MASQSGQNIVLKPVATAAQPEAKPRQVVCVVGAAGGDGVTTIAANLAASLQAGGKHQSVVLMDLDLRGGDLLPFFGLESPRSLREVSGDPARVDEAYLMNLLVKHQSGLHVLPSGYDGWLSGAPNPPCLERVADLAQSLFDIVVVDCGQAIEPATTIFIDRSTVVVVVSSLGLRSVRRARRLFAWLREHGVPSRRIKLIVNRYRPDQEAVLKETESLVGCCAAGVVPDDSMLAEEAVEEGTPMVALAPNSEIGQRLGELVSLCESRRTPEPKSTRAADILRSLRRKWFAGVR